MIGKIFWNKYIFLILNTLLYPRISWGIAVLVDMNQFLWTCRASLASSMSWWIGKIKCFVPLCDILAGDGWKYIYRNLQRKPNWWFLSLSGSFDEDLFHLWHSSEGLRWEWVSSSLNSSSYINDIKIKCRQSNHSCFWNSRLATGGLHSTSKWDARDGFIKMRIGQLSRGWKQKKKN